MCTEWAPSLRPVALVPSHRARCRHDAGHVGHQCPILEQSRRVFHLWRMLVSCTGAFNTAVGISSLGHLVTHLSIFRPDYSSHFSDMLRHNPDCMRTVPPDWCIYYWPWTNSNRQTFCLDSLHCWMSSASYHLVQTSPPCAPLQSHLENFGRCIRSFKIQNWVY